MVNMSARRTTVVVVLYFVSFLSFVRGDDDRALTDSHLLPFAFDSSLYVAFMGIYTILALSSANQLRRVIKYSQCRQYELLIAHGIIVVTTIFRMVNHYVLYFSLPKSSNPTLSDVATLILSPHTFETLLFMTLVCLWSSIDCGRLTLLDPFAPYRRWLACFTVLGVVGGIGLYSRLPVESEEHAKLFLIAIAAGMTAFVTVVLALTLALYTHIHVRWQQTRTTARVNLVTRRLRMVGLAIAAMWGLLGALILVPIFDPSMYAEYMTAFHAPYLTLDAVQLSLHLILMDRIVKSMDETLVKKVIVVKVATAAAKSPTALEAMNAISKLDTKLPSVATANASSEDTMQLTANDPSTALPRLRPTHTNANDQPSATSASQPAATPTLCVATTSLCSSSDSGPCSIEGKPGGSDGAPTIATDTKPSDSIASRVAPSLDACITILDRSPGVQRAPIPTIATSLVPSRSPTRSPTPSPRLLQASVAISDAMHDVDSINPTASMSVVSVSWMDTVAADSFTAPFLRPSSSGEFMLPPSSLSSEFDGNVLTPSIAGPEASSHWSAIGSSRHTYSNEETQWQRCEVTLAVDADGNGTLIGSGVSVVPRWARAARQYLFRAYCDEQERLHPTDTPLALVTGPSEWIPKPEFIESQPGMLRIPFKLHGRWTSNGKIEVVKSSEDSFRGAHLGSGYANLDYSGYIDAAEYASVIRCQQDETMAHRTLLLEMHTGYAEVKLTLHRKTTAVEALLPAPEVGECSSEALTVPTSNEEGALVPLHSSVGSGDCVSGGSNNDDEVFVCPPKYDIEPFLNSFMSPRRLGGGSASPRNSFGAATPPHHPSTPPRSSKKMTLASSSPSKQLLAPSNETTTTNNLTQNIHHNNSVGVRARNNIGSQMVIVNNITMNMVGSLRSHASNKKKKKPASSKVSPSPSASPSKLSQPSTNSSPKPSPVKPSPPPPPPPSVNKSATNRLLSSFPDGEFVPAAGYNSTSKYGRKKPLSGTVTGLTTSKKSTSTKEGAPVSAPVTSQKSGLATSTSMSLDLSTVHSARISSSAKRVLDFTIEHLPTTRSIHFQPPSDGDDDADGGLSTNRDLLEYHDPELLKALRMDVPTLKPHALRLDVPTPLAQVHDAGMSELKSELIDTQPTPSTSHESWMNTCPPTTYRHGKEETHNAKPKIHISHDWNWLATMPNQSPQELREIMANMKASENKEQTIKAQQTNTVPSAIPLSSPSSVPTAAVDVPITPSSPIRTMPPVMDMTMGQSLMRSVGVELVNTNSGSDVPTVAANSSASPSSSQSCSSSATLVPSSFPPSSSALSDASSVVITPPIGIDMPLPLDLSTSVPTIPEANALDSSPIDPSLVQVNDGGPTICLESALPSCETVKIGRNLEVSLADWNRHTDMTGDSSSSALTLSNLALTLTDTNPSIASPTLLSPTGSCNSSMPSSLVSTTESDSTSISTIRQAIAKQNTETAVNVGTPRRQKIRIHNKTLEQMD